MHRRKGHFHSVLATVLSLITLVLSIVALVATISLMFEKKRKEEEELERYLDGSIQ